MTSGYLPGGKPDASWWLEQIRAGEIYRKRAASQERWPLWRAMYRGDWDSRTMPVNLYFVLIRTIIPRVYFRNPSVSVSPGGPGMDNVVFSQVLERTVNKLIRQMGLKKEIKRIVQQAVMFGTGIPKVGFGAFNAPTPQLGKLDQSLTKGGDRVEYRKNVFARRPWFAGIHPGNFVVPAGLDVFDNARWTAERIERPLEDVKTDPRFEGAKNLTAGRFSNELRPNDNAATAHSKVPMVDLYEVRDSKKGNVFVLAAGQKDEKKSTARATTIFNAPDDLQYNGFPSFPVVFNEDDERFWGIPDSKILEPYQREINEIRTQMMKHRRMAIAKVFAEKGAISEDEMSKMLSEHVAAVVETKGDPRNLMFSQVSHMPPELMPMAREIMNDVRESIGFSRNSAGEYSAPSGRHTATEATIVRMASEIRVDERRDMIADMLVQAIECIIWILFQFWTSEDVVEMVGPGGVNIWVRYSGNILKQGTYNVRVDPDSSVPETRALREAKAKEVYNFLKTNPLIDPVKLTQYLLHELHGTQFDDMMRMLPGMGNGPRPGQSMGMQDYSQMLSQSIQGANMPEVIERFRQQPMLPPPQELDDA